MIGFLAILGIPFWRSQILGIGQNFGQRFGGRVRLTTSSCWKLKIFSLSKNLILYVDN
jgi:hypothetical protein